MKKEGKNEKPLQLKQLGSLKGYLIFIALSVGSMALLSFKGGWFAVLATVFLWVRLCKSQQFLLLVSCFLASALLGCYWQWIISSQPVSPTAETIQAVLLVDPNSVEIDGDALTFEGKNQRTKESYVLRYQLKSEVEKQHWLEQTTFFELTGDLELELPMGQRNLAGFDYRQFLLEKGIYRVGKLTVMGAKTDYPAKNPIHLIKTWRRKLAVHIDKRFLPLTASYMKSLFLGIKDSMFKSQREVWSQLGILHFFSISGMHVFFFVGHFRRGLLRLRLTLETVFWLELSFLFVFLFLTGFSTSVGRSVFFMGLGAINRQFNWQFSELDCWSVTLLLSLIVNPYVLFQAAGQLSFGLTFYIIYLKPLVAKVKPLFQHLFFSGCLSILAIPIMSAHFYEWHLLGIGLTFLLMPIFNKLLLPVLSLLLGLSSFLEVKECSQLLETALKAIQQLLLVISTDSALKVVTGRLAPIIYLTCVIASLAWLYRYYQTKIIRWVLLIVICCLPSLAKYTDPRGIIAFVDVGQGDSIFVQRPFHQEAILIDTGGGLSFGERETWQKKEQPASQANYLLIPFLKSRGIQTIDQVFISHAHEDHFGDLLEINKQMEIKELLYSEGSSRQANFQATLAEITPQTQLRITQSGDWWQNQEIRLDLLYPQELGDGGNDDSLVLLLQIKGQKILLTGDLEAAGEKALITHYPELSADILKVGHHGSRTSSTEAFIKKLEGATGIISCGVNNRFGHPHEETLSRLRDGGMEIYQTNQQGMIYYQWLPWDDKLSDIQTIRESH